MYNIKIKSKIKDYELIFIDKLEYIIDISKEENVIPFVDENVLKLYPKLNFINPISIKSIESNKNFIGVDLIINHLMKRNANINTKIIVIGGGIMQDLIGFCASIYARGIEYILVPTTLLSQADSCIGGKTSLNFDNRKNLLGTFYPPSSILIHTDFINTLSKLDYISGMGEIYKFYILKNDIVNFDINSNITEMIYYGLKYKNDILSIDEFDKGERKFLNFGHTFGHALESTSDHYIPHGIAVIIGCMIATMISKKLNYAVDNYGIIIEKGIDLINQSNLKFDKNWFNLNKLLEIIKSDKKNTGKLVMVLIDNKPFLKNIESTKVLEEVLNEIYEII
jgi:3-dehydroquinate synthase